MLQIIVGLLLLISLPAASAGFFYFYDRRRYSEGKQGNIPILPGFRAAYRWVQLSTIAVVVASLCTHYSILLQLHHSTGLFYGGMSCCATALGLYVWAKVRLGAEYSPCSDSRVANNLIDSGPYRFIRHPIYTANLAWLLGWFIASGSVWIVLNLVLIAPYFVTSARQEERALAGAVPGYREYLLRTGAFLPRPWRTSWTSSVPAAGSQEKTSSGH
jgi:protein-S-isoprenylcysteine O-methyltransferase Ste14